MDFSFTDEQIAVRELAAQIFGGSVSVERIKDIERSDDRIDRELWAALANANLLGLSLPEDVGGSGLGLTEVCLLLEQQGRRLAPIPLWPTLIAALAIAEFGSSEQRALLAGVVSGETILTLAFDESGPPVTTDGATVSGTKLAVPAAAVAQYVLVPASDGVYLVDLRGSGVTLEPVDTTDHQSAAHVTFDGAPAQVLGAATPEWVRDRAMVGLTAIQLGVANEALKMAAEYTSGREQFGRPLSTNQGVSLRAADAYIDTSAMDVTLWQAAWRIDNGLDSSKAVTIAKWWAADGGERVVHATQHLHGGMGADIDYPVHRYFLWGKQNADVLGGASSQLARLGAELAAAYK